MTSGYLDKCKLVAARYGKRGTDSVGGRQIPHSTPTQSQKRQRNIRFHYLCHTSTEALLSVIVSSACSRPLRGPWYGIRLSSNFASPAHCGLPTRSLTTSTAIQIFDPLEEMRLEPDFGPNSVYLPPLPVIRDPRIGEQVFTHRSVAARLTHVFEDLPDDPSPDNEKFEHLGDSVLGLVVTNLMFELFPGLRVGPSTKIRSLVVSNFTLADISKRYRLPDRLRLHQAQALTLRASTNVQADVFEAFIGGLFRDQGLPAVQAWLKPLFEPFAREAYHLVRKQHSLPPLPPSHSALGQSSADIATGALGSAPTIGHLALFNQLVAKANKKVEWVHSDGNEPALPQTILLPAPGCILQPNGARAAPIANDSGASTTPVHDQLNGVCDAAVNGVNGHNGNGTWYADPLVPSHLRIKGTHTTPVWYVKVFVDGEFYGRGRGNTKKAARNEAAREGLLKLGVEV
ncbi:ribonuclease III domain-containing protein [Ephemerocybe angulata]|uniref:Ribonuclease III domain-containing protein n=1 Tax=Ephemerocybe angulata TaxID=980116 RepID=A0A8H6MFB1_9AGAR|nr:ribonuclease III domain-containing protein [Tulosesus angulatus]